MSRSFVLATFFLCQSCQQPLPGLQGQHQPIAEDDSFCHEGKGVLRRGGHQLDPATAGVPGGCSSLIHCCRLLLTSSYHALSHPLLPPLWSVAVILASALVCHCLLSAAAITTYPPFSCVTHLLADATKPFPLICCQSCCHVTTCPQLLSFLGCRHCTLLWLIVKLLCASHCRQTIPFCLPPKLLPRCLLSAAVVSLLAPPAMPSFHPLPLSSPITPWLR
jgi:hypothetical protein